MANESNCAYSIPLRTRCVEVPACIAQLSWDLHTKTKGSPSCTVGGSVNWYSHYEKQYGPLKTKNTGTMWPSNLTIGHIPRENHNSKRYMHPSVHWSTIYSLVRMSTDTRIDKEDVVHICNRVLLNHNIPLYICLAFAVEQASSILQSHSVSQCTSPHGKEVRPPPTKQWRTKVFHQPHQWA